MNRNPEPHNPEAVWKVKFFLPYLGRYLEYEVCAPNEMLADMFARKSSIEDGYSRNRLVHIETKRVE